MATKISRLQEKIRPVLSCEREVIATVRIAPVERWCKEAAIDIKSEIRTILLRRGSVSILTESMQMRGTQKDGRFWAVEPKCQAEIDAEAGRPTFSQAYVCEHMLEMD